jgi:lipid A 4'-phosphatase
MFRWRRQMIRGLNARDSLRPNRKEELEPDILGNQRALDDSNRMVKYFLFFLILSSILGMVFFFVPVIDLWAAAEFYHQHRGFVISNPTSSHALPFLPWLPETFVSAALLVLAVNVIRRYFLGKPQPLVASDRVVLFLLLTLGIGPGLLVNAVFKDHWGRARPYQVRQFGGDRRFTAAFVMSDQCPSNCSFVSGDASMGYFGLAFLFLARRRRKLILAASLLAGTLIGLVRMAQGAHFLSDVIFSGVFTFLTGWLFYFLFLHRWQIRQTAGDNHSYEKPL